MCDIQQPEKFDQAASLQVDMASSSTRRWHARQRQKPCHAHLGSDTLANKTSPERRKMARVPSLKATHVCPRPSSSTTSCSWRATFAGIVAAPLFLRYTPPSHPICESSIAIVWRRSSPHRCTPTCLLTGTSLSMNPAAPLLFRNTPACLPIRESISAIVWVRWGGWHCWHHRRQGWQ